MNVDICIDSSNYRDVNNFRNCKILEYESRAEENRGLREQIIAEDSVESRSCQ